MLEKEVKEKNVLIIGGSSGFGLATVRKFASEHHRIWVVHKDKRTQSKQFNKIIEELHQVFECQIKSFNFNAGDKERVSQFVHEAADLGVRFDLVLHAVSRGNLKPLVSKTEESLSSEDIHRTIDMMGINLHFWVTELLSKDLIGEDSRIVALSSEGNKRYWHGYGAVALAKATMETLVKYLSVELAPYRISINTIHAGISDTPSLKMIPQSDELIEISRKRNPLGRMTSPEDVANVVYLLSLPEARWINGSLIHVDGGEHFM